MSAQGGLVASVDRISPTGYPYQVFGASLGDLGAGTTNVRGFVSNTRSLDVGGSGGGLDSELARGIATVEAIERHANCAVPIGLRWATANELDGHVLDMATLPTCTPNEMASVFCPVRSYESDSTIRWAKAWSFTKGVSTWVPAVLVWLNVPPLTPDECFTLPISTGAAAHSTLEAAVLNGILEVVERDAISLVWLQRLTLPEIDLEGQDREIERSLNKARERGRMLHFFDATTNLGIPTVYCVEVNERSKSLRTVVMCDANLNPRTSILKIFRELAASQLGLSGNQTPPQKPDEFTTVYDGALYMGHESKAHVFDFLLSETRDVEKVRLNDLPVYEFPSAIEKLRFVLSRLAQAEMEVVVADITTREAKAAGIHVVKAIVPQLMPLSFVHSARFLAHERLYDAPDRMGFGKRPYEEINPYPQPFA